MNTQIHNWSKLGLILAPIGDGLMKTHAMLPTPMLLADRIRVYFTSCDADLRGRVFFADLDREFPYPVMYVEREPVLDLGKPGNFDADSVNPSHIVCRDGQILLYYIGWQRISEDVPYTLFAGLAKSEDGGQSFTRRQDGPILPPTPNEAFFRTAPFAYVDTDGWSMLYIGGGQFFDGPDGKKLPLYSLKKMSSQDGLEWIGGVETMLEPNRGRQEIGFGRPVLSQQGRARTLMVSVRTISGYSLVEGDFSQSSGSVGPLRPVLSGDVADWESEMTCFGAHCAVDNRGLIFYNGNGFGRTGFGIAWKYIEE